MNFSTLLQYVQEHTGLTIAAAVLAFMVFSLLRANYGFHVWYFITILAALIGAAISDHSAYFIVFLLGGATAFAEIISKFSSEPLEALKTPHAFVYHLLNGAIAAFTLKVLYLYGVANTTDLDHLKNVVVAGLGSMLIMRSKLFNIKVNGEDVSFGPEQIIKIFFRFMEDAIDRVRARWRIDFVKKHLDNIRFESVHDYCVTMLLSAQALDKDRKAACLQEINMIHTSTVMDTQLRSYNLGFILMNEMGENYVAELFGKPKPEWLLSATKPTDKPTESKLMNVNSEGVLSSLSALPFVGTKEESVQYFAYGSNMSERKFLETLVWKQDDKHLIEEMNPQAAVLSGYKLVFNKRRGDASNLEGAPNIVLDESQMVEGVLYQMPKATADFLGPAEKGYHKMEVEVKVRDKEKEKAGHIKIDEPIYQNIKALTFVADAKSSLEGLKPSKESLEVLKEGAKEHDLSEAYLQKLDAIETLPPATFTSVASPDTLNVQTGNTEATM